MPCHTVQQRRDNVNIPPLWVWIFGIIVIGISIILEIKTRREMKKDQK